MQVGNKSFGLEALMKHLGRKPAEVHFFNRKEGKDCHI